MFSVTTIAVTSTIPPPSRKPDLTSQSNVPGIENALARNRSKNVDTDKIRIIDEDTLFIFLPFSWLCMFHSVLLASVLVLELETHET